MAFFDDSFMNNNKDDEMTNPVEDNGITTSNNNFNSDVNLDSNITTSSELEVNKKNREAYENLMENSKTSYDSYYDKNSIFTKIVLFGLLLVIVVGVLYYVLMYFSNR